MVSCVLFRLCHLSCVVLFMYYCRTDNFFFLQIVNGKLKSVISVLLHLTGGAVGFAGLWRELWKFMSVVVRTKMLYGAQTTCKR